MRIARSLRLNRLVDVTECDYKSYLELDLYCPICNTPVFFCHQKYRKEHTRKLKSGKEVTVKKSKEIGDYFAHFSSRSEAENDDCEMRTKTNYTSDKVKLENNKVKIQSKNQRLRAFQKQFWGYLCQSRRMSQIEDDLAFVKAGFLGSTARPTLSIVEKIGMDLSAQYLRYKSDQRLNDFTEEIVLNLYNQRLKIGDSIEQALNNLYDHNLEVLRTFLDDDYGDLRMIDEIKQNSVLREVHREICHEALEFLLNKTSRPILSNLVQKCLCDLILAVRKPRFNPDDNITSVDIDISSFSGKPERILYKNIRDYKTFFQNLFLWNMAKRQEFLSYTICNIALIISVTPWIRIFYPAKNQEVKQVRNTYRNGITQIILDKEKVHYTPYSLTDDTQIQCATKIDEIVSQQVKEKGLNSKIKFMLPSPFTEIEAEIMLIKTIALIQLKFNSKPIGVGAIAWGESDLNEVITSSLITSYAQKNPKVKIPDKNEFYLPWQTIINIGNVESSNDIYQEQYWIEVCFLILGSALIGSDHESKNKSQAAQDKKAAIQEKLNMLGYGIKAEANSM